MLLKNYLRMCFKFSFQSFHFQRNLVGCILSATMHSLQATASLSITNKSSFFDCRITFCRAPNCSFIFLALFTFFTGVPLLFINHNSILLEKPSRASYQASHQVCHLFKYAWSKLNYTNVLIGSYDHLEDNLSEMQSSTAVAFVWKGTRIYVKREWQKTNWNAQIFV